jgi:hypothetical protein
MSFLTDITKKIKGKHTWFFIAMVVVFILFISQYSYNKGSVGEFMTTQRGNSSPSVKDVDSSSSSDTIQPSAGVGMDGGYAQVNGNGNTDLSNQPSGCTNQPMIDPASLLPNDQSNEWNQLNPSGQGDLDGVNLLNAGYHIGVDTVGQTMRNSNLQLRSEPANPQLNVSPWGNSTMEPDTMRVPLELGQGAA